MIELIIVRHGETPENKQYICQGRLDTSLSEIGIAENNKLAMELKSETFDVLISSPLKRAKQTANQIHDYHQSIPFKVDERIIEWNLGELQGYNFPEDFSIRNNYPGSESFEEVKERVISFLNELWENYQNKTILMVSHGLTIKMFNHVLKNIPFENTTLHRNSTAETFLINQNGF